MEIEHDSKRGGTYEKKKERWALKGNITILHY